MPETWRKLNRRLMKPSAAPASSPASSAPAQPSGSRVLLVALIFFLLGAILAGVLFKSGKAGFLAGQGASVLPGDIADQLRHLAAPVQLRFYSVLPPGSASEALQNYSSRVDHLLSKIEDINGSRIHVVRNISTVETNADAATADGIQAFNLDKGEACFLGITVNCEGRKTSLARLQPAWEPALPFDLARAILQVTAPAAAAVAKSAPISPAVTNEIQRLIPDLNGTSLEDGSRILRQASVQQLMTAGAEAENQINQAKQQLAEAQANGSDTAVAAAQKHLQEVQSQQALKVQTIAAQLQDELTVFQQMKAAAAPAK